MPQIIELMETLELLPLTKVNIITQQRQRLERVLAQVEPGLAIEIIRFGEKSLRSLSSHTYTGGNKEFYNNIIITYFNDACNALREGQRIRIQLVRG